MLENLGNNNFSASIFCVAVGVCDVTNKVDKSGRNANWLVAIEPIRLRPEELRSEATRTYVADLLAGQQN